MEKGSEEPVEWVEETQAVKEYRIDVEALRNWEHIFRHKVVGGVYYYPREDLEKYKADVEARQAKRTYKKHVLDDVIAEAFDEEGNWREGYYID
ncbi:MAG: hypothetical protein QM571_06425 [Micrococcaceae bacterium]